ncbi:von Willebrand factor A domain-containing protein 5A-like [Dysidea avara]|uniref:von Willebrand factor A domain-containing protein 5A-like n=1 Tax=Dysidea avara TaxID=196820 RepID=UPI00332AEB1F
MEGLVSSDNKTVLPLKDVSVHVNVKGYLVSVSSTISYSNDTSNPLEVTFRFPLEESFAVVQLEATIDGKNIKATIHEKEKARDMYDDVTRGLFAAYAEEKSGDIFSLSLGNLPSGSKAKINIRMVGELPIEADGCVRFTLPSVLKPHYTPQGSTDPLATTQNPSVKHASVAGVFQFKMTVEGASRVAKVSSPTH